MLSEGIFQESEDFVTDLFSPEITDLPSKTRSVSNQDPEGKGEKLALFV